jgi:hypothetical protein
MSNLPGRDTGNRVGRIVSGRLSSQVDNGLVRLPVTPIRITNVELEALRTFWHSENGNPVGTFGSPLAESRSIEN